MLCDVLETLAVEPEQVDTSQAAPATASADPVHLHQILSNLISNARKYGNGHVFFRSWTDAAQVHLSIEDDGPGVEPDFVPHLFDRFSRSVASRRGSERGTGLGLSIVRDLTEMNGGGIDYSRSDRGGARFTVHLPAGSSS
ncbi:MAG: ATP-binding protein [Microbacterium sp.]|nr:MAG: ATP-binding protein [Microbacterium sp.]